MQSLWQDLRYSLRSLLRQPGLTIAVVFSLALGIGSNTAIFSVINTVLLRPQLYDQPEQLVMLWGSDPKTGRRDYPLAPAEFAELQAQSQSFAALAASRHAIYNLTGQGDPEQVLSYRLAANFLPVLGLQPALGRGFTAEDDQPGGGRVALLGYRLWQRRFGGDRNVVGKSLRLDEENFTVIGVMPRGFEHPRGAELWTPLGLDPAQMNNHDQRALRVVARLKPNVSLEQAQAEMDNFARRWEQEHPRTNAGWQLRLVSLQDQYTGQIKPALRVLMGAVAFVLLIACANVANLLLARGARRATETSLRAALGAGRIQLLRLFVIEGVLLALLGALLSLPLAQWSIKLLLGLFPNNLTNVQIPRVEEIKLDARVLTVNLLVALGCGLIFGLAPALQAFRLDLSQALKEGRVGLRPLRFGRRFPLRNLLVIGEVALALVLLTGAGLMIKSFLRLRAVDLGFNPNKILTLRIELASGKKYLAADERRAFVRQLLPRLNALPGVESAALINTLPLSGWTALRPFTMARRPAPPPGERLECEFRIVSSGYFQTLSINQTRGRGFTDEDHERSAPVIVVNEKFARRFFPNGDALGQRLTFPASLGQVDLGPREVVGVIADIKHENAATDAKLEVYAPYLQEPSFMTGYALRTKAEPMAVASAVRAAVWALNRDLPISFVMPLEKLAAESIARQRIAMILLSSYAIIALILAGVGIYGVLMNAVNQRQHELGIRMALGAQPRDLLKMVVGQGMKLTAIGLGLGLLSAFVLTRLMAHLLYGVTVTDPIIFILVTLFLCLVALLACYLPAYRATKIDPLNALREE